MKLIKKIKGNVALTAVVVIGFMLLVTGTSVIILSMDLSIATKHFENGSKARLNTRTCFEEAMRALSDDDSFTGDLEYTYDGVSCTATVTDDTDPNVKVVTVTSTATSDVDYTETSEKRVDISQDPIAVIE